MTPPTPAAVRWAMRINYDEGSPEERAAYFADERGSEDMLADHIRAVAADLRAQANICEEKDGSYLEPTMLRAFADKLEGKA